MVIFFFDKIHMGLFSLHILQFCHFFFSSTIPIYISTLSCYPSHRMTDLLKFYMNNKNDELIITALRFNLFLKLLSHLHLHTSVTESGVHSFEVSIQIKWCDFVGYKWLWSGWVLALTAVPLTLFFWKYYRQTNKRMSERVFFLGNSLYASQWSTETLWRAQINKKKVALSASFCQLKDSLAHVNQPRGQISVCFGSQCT